MAVWIEDQKSIADKNRKLRGGAMTRYGADTVDDISTLPGPNGQNQGSSVVCLEDGGTYILGTDPAAGTNGWVKKKDEIGSNSGGGDVNVDFADLISGDADNFIEQGSDNKLFVGIQSITNAEIQAIFNSL